MCKSTRLCSSVQPVLHACAQAAACFVVPSPAGLPTWQTVAGWPSRRVREPCITLLQPSGRDSWAPDFGRGLQGVPSSSPPTGKRHGRMVAAGELPGRRRARRGRDQGPMRASTLLMLGALLALQGPGRAAAGSCDAACQQARHPRTAAAGRPQPASPEAAGGLQVQQATLLALRDALGGAYWTLPPPGPPPWLPPPPNFMGGPGRPGGPGGNPGGQPPSSLLHCLCASEGPTASGQASSGQAGLLGLQHL